ncbi:hypothetical protein FMN63_09155 [Stappia sp. BW2]|uniref:hypothetical protein n=1 Tax=Stappia sp. BW2 TaxID=2592622 RepID=UPI0011DE8A00|nr:hypothetical protein [Stappia sp. BW2]TYC70065.1 hypothetical protein FMN63_09155 [Stappia sp. BW2]
MAVTASASVAQYMNYAETDCNTEIEEFLLAFHLWISYEISAGKSQISAAFSTPLLLWPVAKSR